MAVRRTVGSLAEELASLGGVSKNNAVRIALSEAIAREGGFESVPDLEGATSLVPAIVPRQVGLVETILSGA